MTTVLVTGGTGFIGSQLAARCVHEGEHVRVLAQTNTEAERRNAGRLRLQGIEIVAGSVTDAEATRRACEGVDVVYHLAAAQHEANVPDSHFHAVNVDGTRNMIEAAIAAGVGRFVHGSTIGVYGKPARWPVDEDTPLEPENIYGVTKLAGEEVVREYRDRLAIPIVRIAETYGPGDWRLLKLFRGIEKGRLLRIGPGQNLHHLVYIDDLVEGLRRSASLDSAAGRTYVLAGAEAVTTDAMIDAIARALSHEPPRLRVPMWPLMAGAVVMENTLGRIGIQPPLHRRRMNFFVKSFRFQGDDARAAIDFQPETDVVEGMKRTASWYRSEGLIAASEGRPSERPEGERTNTMNTPNLEQPRRVRALSARTEAFDSFWEGPADIEAGYRSFGTFYRANYLSHMPSDRGARTLVISCGPGYFVNLLADQGYTDVLGIDSDPEKVKHGVGRGLNCRCATAFETLIASDAPYDVIFCEQELNHLTKAEMVEFLELVWQNLRPGGRLICHGLNGANPIVGAETLAQNLDHFNSFTSYSLKQVLEFTGFEGIHIFGLNLYVFKKNPLNYVAAAVAGALALTFRAFFMLYGKSNKIFTKKIAAVAERPHVTSS